jgi:O-antigen biosynthesis protein
LPKVSLVIPTRDRLPLLERCVESIRALTTYPDYEIIVVDNQSVEPETLAYLATLAGSPRIRVIPHDKPFNYSAICNSAVADVDGAIVGLVNNDVEVISPDWLERMVQHAARPGVGAVGAMLYYPDDTIQHAGVVVGLGGVAGHAFAHAPRGAPGDHGRASLTHAVSAVTAACLLVRRDVYLEAGGLDESLQVAFNDIDFCLKLLDLGYRNVWTPFAELYHHESASRGAEDTPEKQRRFQREVEAMQARWHRRLHADPSYNPNLSLVVGQAFMRADPPRMTLASWCDQLRAQACPTRRQP